VNLRVLILGSFLLLATAQASHAAATVSVSYCNEAFRALALPKVETPPAAPNFPTPNTWTVPAEMSAKQTAALERLRPLEAVKVSEIFPETVKAYDVTKVKTPDAATAAYRKKFDEIWKARVESGLVPSFELGRYRKWLLAQNPNNPLAYPAVDAADIYNKFVKNDRPLAEYFNEKFLEFVEKETGRNDFASVDDYFRQVDRNKAKYYLGQTWKGTKNIGRKLKLNVTLIPTTVVAGTVLGYQTEITNKATGWLFGTAKDAATNAVGSSLESAWNTGWGFASAEDLNKAFDTVNIATESLTKSPFDKYLRTQGVNAMLTVRKQYEAIMPSFKDFLSVHKKEFDSSSAAHLKDISGDNRDARADYDSASRELQRLQKAMEQDAELQIRRNAGEKLDAALPPPRDTFEDLQRMATLRQKMDRSEDFLAGSLAKYLLYSSTRGSKNPVDDVLQLRYENLLEDYLASMSLQKLQKAWLAQVNEHTAMLKSFMPKIVAPDKTIAEKAQEDKKAAEAAKKAQEEAKAKAEATRAAAEKTAAQKGEQAAKEIVKDARKAEEEARKAEEEARKKAEEARKSEEKAKVDPLAKPEEPKAAPAPAAEPEKPKAATGG
jgi:hypothetical protein